jgi:hypothetical protein
VNDGVGASNIFRLRSEIDEPEEFPRWLLRARVVVACHIFVGETALEATGIFAFGSSYFSSKAKLELN